MRVFLNPTPSNKANFRIPSSPDLFSATPELCQQLSIRAVRGTRREHGEPSLCTQEPSRRYLIANVDKTMEEIWRGSITAFPEEEPRAPRVIET